METDYFVKETLMPLELVDMVGGYVSDLYLQDHKLNMEPTIRAIDEVIQHLKTRGCLDENHVFINPTDVRIEIKKMKDDGMNIEWTIAECSANAHDRLMVHIFHLEAVDRLRRDGVDIPAGVLEGDYRKREAWFEEAKNVLSERFNSSHLSH